MIHRCQILKADLKHCQHLGGDDPTRVADSKLLMLNFAIPSAGGPYIKTSGLSQRVRYRGCGGKGRNTSLGKAEH